MRKEKTIKIYRYDSGCHCEGGLFPPYDNRQTDWSANKQEQIDLYNSASVQFFDKDELEEMVFYNKTKPKDKPIMFIWCFLFEIEVPLKEWEKCLKEDDFEILPYLVDYNYTDLAEKGIYPNGRNMSKKMLDSIVYEPFKATNTDRGGVFKPKNVVYGNYNILTNN